MARTNGTGSTTTRRPGRTATMIFSTVVVLFALSSCGVEGGGEEVGASGPVESSTTAAPVDDGDGDGEGDDTTTTTDPDDEPADTTTTTEADDGAETTTTFGGIGGQADMMRDALIQGFESAGFTTEQATCLADGYIDMGITDPEASGDMDIMGMMDLFTRCGVSMEDLGQLGAGMGA